MTDAHPLSQRLAAEFFGTFWLVFGGCGAAVLASGVPGVGIGYLGVAVAFGLTVLTMAYAVGHVCGGHFNPAISLGLATAQSASTGATCRPTSSPRWSPPSPHRRCCS